MDMRFHNLVLALRECLGHMSDETLTREEAIERFKFVKLCEHIVGTYGDVHANSPEPTPLANLS